MAQPTKPEPGPQTNSNGHGRDRHRRRRLHCHGTGRPSSAICRPPVSQFCRRTATRSPSAHCMPPKNIDRSPQRSAAWVIGALAIRRTGAAVSISRRHPIGRAGGRTGRAWSRPETPTPGPPGDPWTALRLRRQRRAAPRGVVTREAARPGGWWRGHSGNRACPSAIRLSSTDKADTGTATKTNTQQ